MPRLTPRRVAALEEMGRKYLDREWTLEQCRKRLNVKDRCVYDYAAKERRRRREHDKAKKKGSDGGSEKGNVPASPVPRQDPSPPQAPPGAQAPAVAHADQDATGPGGLEGEGVRPIRGDRPVNDVEKALATAGPAPAPDPGAAGRDPGGAPPPGAGAGAERIDASFVVKLTEMAIYHLAKIAARRYGVLVDASLAADLRLTAEEKSWLLEFAPAVAPYLSLAGKYSQWIGVGMFGVATLSIAASKIDLVKSNAEEIKDATHQPGPTGTV